MAQGPIDASLRRPNLRDEDRGNVIPDSRRKITDTPLVVMEPGAERLSLLFADGLGVGGLIGNFYVGYGAAGGASPIVTQTPSDTLEEGTIGAAILNDILVFDDTDELYKPVQASFLNIIQTDGAAPFDDDILVFDDVLDLWISKDITFLDIPTIFDLPELDAAAVVDLGDVMIANGSGTFNSVPQVTKDFIAYTIEVAQNRVYTLVPSLPYDITITATSDTIASGSATVVFPSGIISAGNPVNVTVSAVSSPSFLRLQIDFTYNLGIS